MRTPGESVARAEAEYKTFISIHENAALKAQIKFWLAGRTAYSNEALAEFGAALHAILDSTSPTHAGFQVWDPRDVNAVVFHRLGESSIYPQELQDAVAAAKNAFNATFFPYDRFDLLEQILAPRSGENVTSKVCWLGPNGNVICQ
jgi:hypothetical protein